MKRLFWLLILLAFALPEAANAVTPEEATSYKNDGVVLRLSEPSGSVYQEGESVRFTVQSDSDAYVVVFNIDTQGFVHILYPVDPNSFQEFSADQSYDIPPSFEQEFLITGKTGIEFVFAVAVTDRDAIDSQALAFFRDDESRPPSERYRVVGDPFLAANRIASRLVKGIAYTRDESLAFSYFYVNKAVGFPRYLCEECYDEGKDPYSGEFDYVATSVFDREDRLSYPLKRGFVRSDENVARDDSGDNPGVASDGSPTPVYVYNYYGDSRPWYPYWGYAGYPYYGSGFYFSIGWNWGFGYRWGYPYHYYPYYPYGYGWCYPYAAPYYGHYYHHGYRYPVTYRPTLRPHSPYRYKGGSSRTYTAKVGTSDRLRAKTTRYERTDKVKSGGGRTTYVNKMRRGTTRPVHKVTAKRSVRTERGVRGYPTRKTVKLRSASGHKSSRGKAYAGRPTSGGVRTIKGRPSTRPTITRRQAVRGSRPSSRSVRSSSKRFTTSTTSRGRASYSRPTVRRSSVAGRSSIGRSGSSGRGGKSGMSARGSRGGGGRRK
jgi:hypothetical protein